MAISTKLSSTTTASKSLLAFEAYARQPSPGNVTLHTKKMSKQHQFIVYDDRRGDAKVESAQDVTPHSPTSFSTISAKKTDENTTFRMERMLTVESGIM